MPKLLKKRQHRCPAKGCRKRPLEQMTMYDWRCPRCLRGYIYNPKKAVL